MASYVVVPKTLNISEIKNNKLILAPSRYSKFIPKNKDYFISLKDSIWLSTRRKRIKSNEKYYYIEIGDINVNSGYPNYKIEWGYKLPSNNPLELKQNDIVISTVRTYRKGIGFIDKEVNNIVGSSAFLVVRDIKNNMFSKEYLFSILRHDFFIEQILSLQNRGMYPRIDRDNLHLVFIPKPRNIAEHNYVTILTKAIINKEKEIRRKHQLILEKIEKELLENQKPNKFKYKLPDIREIEKVGRLDTKLYKKEYKYYEFLIKNYKGGFFYLEESDLKGGSTPKQNERIFGKGEFTWVTPTFISKYGFLNKIKKIAIKSKKYNIKKDCLILINRGNKEDLIRGFYYDYKILGAGQHNQGCYRIEKKNYDLIFLTALLNSKIYRNFVSNLSVGSKMPEIKISQIINISFPDFSESKQKEIAELYYNSIDYPTNLNFNNFLEEDTKWNEKAGIIQLDMSAKKLRERIDEVIHRIVMDDRVEIIF